MTTKDLMMQTDRSLRSVFVGNIPYDATEDKLRNIFSAVGPVLSFKILYDHETGKPKGYGFCEYKDEETATSAVRNLNGHDMCGRILRVDSASKDKARVDTDQPHSVIIDNMMQPMHGVQLLLDPQTIINNVLCSLTPEHLFEIIQQLQASLDTNPNETRHLLTQNPQLSFATLQILVMLGAIDAEKAVNSLHEQLMPTLIQPVLLNDCELVGYPTNL